jgi:hypothetical protein
MVTLWQIAFFRLILWQIVSGHIFESCMIQMALSVLTISTWRHMQSAYQDAEAASTAFQAIAPVGVQHLQYDALVLSDAS